MPRRINFIDLSRNRLDKTEQWRRINVETEPHCFLGIAPGQAHLPNYYPAFPR